MAVLVQPLPEGNQALVHDNITEVYVDLLRDSDGEDNTEHVTAEGRAKRSASEDQQCSHVKDKTYITAVLPMVRSWPV